MGGVREPIIKLPGVVTALLTIMVAIQLLAALGPKGMDESFVNDFAFYPIRLSFLLSPQSVLDALWTRDGDDQQALAIALGAGRLVYLTPITYAFLHGGWTHLAVNGLTFAAFGAPVARRLGDRLFLIFLAACAVAGALTHYVFHPMDATPVVGASAAIAGTMAAIVRFAFAPGSRLGEDGAMDVREARTPSLAQLKENRQAMAFLVLWFAANFLFGAFPQAAGSSETIAWEAHIGGFLCGLLAYGVFDNLARTRP